jgi:hypothetical protein
MVLGFLYWNEAAVASRSGDVIDVTYTGGDPTGGASAAIMLTLEGVDQTTPVDASDSDAGASVLTASGLPLSLTTTATGLVIAAACVHATGISTSWSGVGSEIFDIAATNYRHAANIYTPGSTSYSLTVIPSSTADMAVGAASFKAVSSSSIAPLVAHYRMLRGS